MSLDQLTLVPKESPPVGVLDASAFELLSEQEKRYSLALLCATWAATPVVLDQVSAES
ncbi:hypothetical protein KIPB_013709, partial [Kipferlia bialata]|eukprot:g13709.t1